MLYCKLEAASEPQAQPQTCSLAQGQATQLCSIAEVSMNRVRRPCECVRLLWEQGSSPTKPKALPRDFLVYSLPVRPVSSKSQEPLS